MSDSRVVFKHCGEALIRSIEPKLNPELREKLDQAGLPTTRELPPGFEYQQWERILSVVGESLMPGDPGAAHHAIGEWITDAYLENFIGRALKPVIKLIGMNRALGRMRQNFRVANNYSEVTVSEKGPGHVQLHVNEKGLMAYFYRGILDRGLRICDPRDLVVRIASEDESGVVYDVTWTP